MEYKIFKEFYVKTKLLTFLHKPFSHMTEQSLADLFCASPVATHVVSYVASRKETKISLCGTGVRNATQIMEMFYEIITLINPVPWQR